MIRYKIIYSTPKPFNFLIYIRHPFSKKRKEKKNYQAHNILSPASSKINCSLLSLTTVLKPVGATTFLSETCQTRLVLTWKSLRLNCSLQRLHRRWFIFFLEWQGTCKLKTP